MRSSTRATSDGCERARKQFGRFPGSSRTNVPDCTIWSHSRSYSACEPSVQATWSGWHRAAISLTHVSSFWFLVGAVAVALITASCDDLVLGSTWAPRAAGRPKPTATGCVDKGARRGAT